MPTFTPRTTKEGMSSPSSPYNNVNTYQCTYYCLGRLGEMSGEPVQNWGGLIIKYKYGE